MKITEASNWCTKRKGTVYRFFCLEIKTFPVFALRRDHLYLSINCTNEREQTRKKAVNVVGPSVYFSPREGSQAPFLIGAPTRKETLEDWVIDFEVFGCDI